MSFLSEIYNFLNKSTAIKELIIAFRFHLSKKYILSLLVLHFPYQKESYQIHIHCVWFFTNIIYYEVKIIKNYAPNKCTFKHVLLFFTRKNNIYKFPYSFFQTFRKKQHSNCISFCIFSKPFSSIIWKIYNYIHLTW